MNWRKRIVFSIIIAIVLVIGLLFGITNIFFVSQLKKNDEKIAKMNFQQAEKSLYDIMNEVAQQGRNYYMSDAAWNFSKQDYKKSARNAEVDRAVVQAFEEMMNLNSNLFGCVQLNGNGTWIMCTKEGNCRTGTTEIQESFSSILERAQDMYPYYVWMSTSELDHQELSLSEDIFPTSMLLGVRSVNGGETTEEDSFLFSVLLEDVVCKCYESVVYNNSQALLVNEKNEVFSATEKEMIGKKYQKPEETKEVSYPLSYHGWTMVNLISSKSYQESTRNFQEFSSIIAVIAIICVIAISLMWSRKYTRPIQFLMEQMEQVKNEQFDIEKPGRTGWMELDELNMKFYDTIQKMKSYMKKLTQTEQEKSYEELKALQYQINPHFLYNSLNSIRWMAMMTNNTKVADSLVCLSRIVAPVFRNPSFTWTIKEETSFVNDYIKMMGIRYGEMLDYQLHCPEELENTSIPRFVLQPVIENCFVHGEPEQGIRKIEVWVERNEEGMWIRVRNNTTQIDIAHLEEINRKLRSAEGKSTGKEIGLYNVVKRLRLLYGNNSGIRMVADSDTQMVVEIHY